MATLLVLIGELRLTQNSSKLVRRAMPSRPFRPILACLRIRPCLHEFMFIVQVGRPLNTIPYKLTRILSQAALYIYLNLLTCHFVLSATRARGSESQGVVDYRKSGVVTVEHDAY